MECFDESEYTKFESSLLLEIIVDNKLQSLIQSQVAYMNRHHSP